MVLNVSSGREGIQGPQDLKLACSNVPVGFLTTVAKGASEGSFPLSSKGRNISPSVQDSASCHGDVTGLNFGGSVENVGE